MIPGEVFPKDGELTLNEGSEAVTLTVANSGDRPIQVGSHYQFAETNPALDFDRDAARGMRLWHTGPTRFRRFLERGADPRAWSRVDPTYARRIDRHLTHAGIA